MSRVKVSFLRLMCLLMVMMFSFTLTGCADGETVYDKLLSYELTDEELHYLSEGKLTYEFDKSDFDSSLDYYKYLAATWLSRGSSLLRQYAVYVIIVCECIGILLFLSAKKSIQIRKFALMVFIIGIPLVCFLAVYGTAILADSF